MLEQNTILPDQMNASLPLGWTPRYYQVPAWKYLENGGKRLVLVWHRRAGKDNMCLHWANYAAYQRPGTYWHMLPEAAQGKKAIWNAMNEMTGNRLIDEAFPEFLRANTNETEMFIRFKNGSTWQVVGSDNFKSLIGSPPVGVVYSEYAVANPDGWNYIRPILANNGGWALFVSTPRGDNHFHNLYLHAKDSPEWFSEKLTALDTNVFTKETLDSELKELIKSKGIDDGTAFFNQEYMCSFNGAVSGSIFGNWIQEAEDGNRIGNYRGNPKYPINACWDLGMNDSMAIWLYQNIGQQTVFLHSYSNRMEPLSHYAQYIYNFVTKQGCVFGRSILPHDARVRDMTSGNTRIETLDSLGMTCVIAPNISLEEGIHSVRNLLRTAYFDRQGCEEGLKALRHYHRKKNEINNVYMDKPVHDWSSHLCDSMRYCAVTPVQTGFMGSKPAMVARPLQQGSWNI